MKLGRVRLTLMITDTLLLFHCCEFFHTLSEASGSLLVAIANTLLSKKDMLLSIISRNAPQR